MPSKEVVTFWLDMGAPMGLISRGRGSRLSSDRVARAVKGLLSANHQHHYHAGMRNLPTILLALSLPAGLIGWFIGSALLSAMSPGNTGILALFVPLLVAGLCMMPFLIPYVDRRAKADLEAIRRQREAEGTGSAGGGSMGGGNGGSRPD